MNTAEAGIHPLVNAAEPRAIAESWARDFELAASAGQVGAADALFVGGGWWRDILSTGWDFRTAEGEGQLREMLSAAGSAGYRTVRVAEAPAPTLDNLGRDGHCILAMLEVETGVGIGRGVVRLRQDSFGDWKAWTLVTALDDITGHEQARGHRRPLRTPAASTTSRENWADSRAKTQQFEDTTPDVVIIGAGQGGLMVAAHLGFWGVSTLIVDRNERVGDNWRGRYRSLVLHDAIWADHLPGLPFPDSWPVYMPKDKLGDWLEFYASAMELNVWNSSSVVASTFNDAEQRWDVVIRRADGSERTVHPRHVVMATGIHGTPKIPDIPGRDAFRGPVVHSSEYTGEEVVAGNRALIVGAGNSAHDVAQDLSKRGFAVTMVQRSSTYVVAQKTNYDFTIGRLFHEDGMATEQADLLGASFPYRLALQRAVTQTAEMAELDSEMLRGLDAADYKYDLGIEGAGGLSKILYGPGGYYIDVGCAQLIIDGRVQITHAGVAELTADGARFDDGTTGEYDIIVMATGYTTLRDTARLVLGDTEADRCGPVWGLDEEGEIRGMWRPSGHPGMWFMGGPLYIARFHSRFLALQLHADLLGLRSRAAG